MRYLFILLLLLSCTRVETEGPDTQGYFWRKDGLIGKPVVHVISDGNVVLFCGFEEKALSCARIENGICDIFIPSNAPFWMEPHERKHCDGWTHPNPIKDSFLK